VILVNGQQLAELMIDHGVGVTIEHAYEVKRLDLDYFVSDEGSSTGAPGVAVADDGPTEV
jgi:hypothetical protein